MDHADLVKADAEDAKDSLRSSCVVCVRQSVPG